MSKHINLSIIIPAYNEEKKIAKDIHAAMNFFKRYSLKGEVIVSTDGVTDKTNEIVTKLKKTYYNLYLLAQKRKIGKGAALKKGVRLAKGNIIMFADAGLCVPYKDAMRGLALLNNGFDCAFGSRALPESNVIKKQPLYRIVGSEIFGMIVRTIIRVPQTIEDTQCGFKLFKKKVAKNIFSQLNSRGMMFDIEILLRLKRDKCKIVPFPVSWKSDNDTKFNPITGSVQNFIDLFLIKLVYRL